MSGRLIGPKTWDRNVRIFGTRLTVRNSVGTVSGVCVIIYSINYVLVCMRPEMTKDFGSIK